MYFNVRINQVSADAFNSFAKYLVLILKTESRQRCTGLNVFIDQLSVVQEQEATRGEK